MKAAALALAIAGAIGGVAVAFGAWGVGYCGGLTPDVASPGTLRADLCTGTSGDVTSGVVFTCWILAALAPLVGLRWALARDTPESLLVATVAGWLPIIAVAVLSVTLPGH